MSYIDHSNELPGIGYSTRVQFDISTVNLENGVISCRFTLRNSKAIKYNSNMRAFEPRYMHKENIMRYYSKI